MASSVATTWLGPAVSLRTSLSNPTAPHLYIDSNSTLEVDGRARFDGLLTSTSSVSFQNAKLFSRATSGSASSVLLADGEIAVTNISVSSCVIAFRSGVTTYVFRAEAASVL